MTREEYLELKEITKKLGKKRKLQKQISRKAESERARGLKSTLTEKEDKIWGGSYYREFRANHIFLSLCRGKTRKQIENNYLDQDFADQYYINRDIKKLCKKYELEFDEEEVKSTKFVISIARTWIPGYTPKLTGVETLINGIKEMVTA